MLDGWNTDWLRRLWRSGQPYCLVQKSSAQSISDSTLTTVVWGMDLFDTWGMHDVSTNTERINIPLDGRYLITALLSWEGNSTGVRQLSVSNTTKTFAYDLVPAAAASLQTRHSVSVVHPFTKGDYVFVEARHTAGAPLNIETNNTISQFMAIRLG